MQKVPVPNYALDGFELSKMQLMVDLLGERLNLFMCPLII